MIGAIVGGAARARAAGAAVICVGALACCLSLAPPAAADAASAHLYTVAGSRKLEAVVAIEHECEQGEACQWSGQVSAYGAEEECPEELEPQARVWSSRIRHSTASASGHFTFAPASPGAATLCLYLNLPLEEETELLETISESATAPASAGGSEHGGGPGARVPGSAAAPGGGAAGAPTSTTAMVYRPFAANGGIQLRARVRRGYCWTGSSSAARRDAWRCMSADRILDPCFSASLHAQSVLCPTGPWSHRGLRLRLTRALPRRFANTGKPSLAARPWAIELSNGRRALFSSGASSVVEGVRLNYFFGSASHEGLWGFPDRGVEPWTIMLAPFDAHRLQERVSIRRAWM